MVMKKFLLSGLASALLLPAQAQLFSPEAFTGAGFGALIGGLVGSDGHHHGCHYSSGFSGEGAAIGAGIGLLTGALIGEANRQQHYDSPGYVYAPTPAPSVSFGYGYSGHGSATYVYYAPNAYTAPGYYYQPARPNYAVGGTLLGAASGALIGSASCNAGKGAAIGAASGFVLGGLAEHATRQHEQRVANAQTTTPPQVQRTATTAPQPDTRPQTPDSRTEITSHPSPTSTYYWTTPPQIADAARVPDAPRF